MLRDDLERLLDDVTLVTLALAIAIGYSLFQFAKGTATFIDGLTTHLSDAQETFSVNGYGLTWAVGHRFVTLDALLVGAIELAMTLAVALLVARQSRRS